MGKTGTAPVVFFFALCLVGVTLFGCGPGFYLSRSDLKAAKLAAVRGDGDAAFKVARYYGNRLLDLSSELFWLTIGAENGHVVSTHDLVLYSTSNKNNKEGLMRGYFWLDKTPTIFDLTHTLWIEDIGYSVDPGRPPSDVLFPPMQAFSESDLARYKEGALQGSGRAALVLANYLGTGGDAESAEYWYRIGAQNGNSECMQWYGGILLGKEETLDQERGKFWLRRADGGD